METLVIATSSVNFLASILPLQYSLILEPCLFNTLRLVEFQGQALLAAITLILVKPLAKTECASTTVHRASARLDLPDLCATKQNVLTIASQISISELVTRLLRCANATSFILALIVDDVKGIAGWSFVLKVLQQLEPQEFSLITLEAATTFQILFVHI